MSDRISELIREVGRAHREQVGFLDALFEVEQMLRDQQRRLDRKRWWRR